MEVKNQCGSSKDSIFVKVENCECYFWMPNAFTPNNDGLNDIFNIKSECEFIEFNLEIYDRWGEKVFVTHDLYHGWDGRIKGKKIGENGVYVWLLSYKAEVNHKIKEELKWGKVTLIR